MFFTVIIVFFLIIIDGFRLGFYKIFIPVNTLKFSGWDSQQPHNNDSTTRYQVGDN